MLLQTSQIRTRRTVRRAAFTLLEVLIVVAILVILAGSASVAVFKYLDTAKEGRAKADMMAIEKAIKTVYLDNQGQGWPTPAESQLVASKLETGPSGLTSPWGTPYTWQIGQDQNGNDRVQLQCTTDKGKVITWPDQGHR